MDLLQKTVLRTITTPAENKWTKLQPVVSRILLMLSFCGLVQAAIRLLKPEQDKEQGPPPNFAEDLSHRPPKVRRARAFSYLMRPESKIELALWMSVAGQVMHVHYYLFHCATWWSHRRIGRNSGANIHDFMDERRNPAVAVAKRLSALLSERTPLTPASYFFGGVPVGEWPAWVRDRARVLLFKTVGMLWRHLWADLQRYPYLLAPLAQQQLQGPDGHDVADRVMQQLRVAPACCVDKGFSGRWREMQGGDPMDDEARFLFEVLFDRVVVTSTFVERIFSSLTRWCRVRQGLPSVAARHTLNVFSGDRNAMLDPNTTRGQKRNQRHYVPESATKRPIWNQTKRVNVSLSGFTLFKRSTWHETVGSFAERQAECHRRWSSLPADDRAPFEKKALEERAVANLVPSRLEASESRMSDAPADTDDPWGLGSCSTPHPLSPDALRDLLARPAGFQKAVADWDAACNTVVQPDVDFRKGLETEEICRVGECLQGLSDEARAGVKAMRETLRLLFKHTDTSRFAALPLLAYDVDGVTVYALVLEHSFDAPCTATVCTLEPASGPGTGGQVDGGGMPLPFGLRVRHRGRSVAGELPLDTEISFFKQLVARRAAEWRLSLLGWNGDAKFEHITVVSRTAFASAELQARDAALREAERALRLTKQLGEGKVRRSKRASAIGQRPVVRREKRARPSRRPSPTANQRRAAHLHRQQPAARLRFSQSCRQRRRRRRRRRRRCNRRWPENRSLGGPGEVSDLLRIGDLS